MKALAKRKVGPSTAMRPPRRLRTVILIGREELAGLLRTHLVRSVTDSPHTAWKGREREKEREREGERERKQQQPKKIKK